MIKDAMMVKSLDHGGNTTLVPSLSVSQCQCSKNKNYIHQTDGLCMKTRSRYYGWDPQPGNPESSEQWSISIVTPRADLGATVPAGAPHIGYLLNVGGLHPCS